MSTYFLALPDGQCIRLDRDILRIGRTPLGPSQHNWMEARIEGDSLYLPDSCLSRRHAVMTRSVDGNYLIADAGSRSGTYVNGEQIKDPTPLRTGDRIKIGSVWIEYCDDPCAS
jgi:pSer/pThr/pTyr-binding forkhead associated (FHA) protein